MKKILITGGNGFIGSYLVNYCLKKKYKVLNIDKLSSVSQKLIIKDKNYRFIKNNLLNLKQLKRIILNFNPNFIINCSAESHVDRSIINPSYFIENNIIGTSNILEIIKNTKIRFLQVSTDEVFGSLNLNQKKFKEDNCYDPRSPYSASKAACDHLVRSFGETFGIDYVITNCSNNYGPFQFPEKLIPVIIKNCILKEPIPIYGDGKNIRDWIYVEDHVRGILKVLIYGKKSNTYLIGSNNEISNIDLTYKICKIYDEIIKNQNSKKLIKFVKDRKGHDFRYAINSKKIRTKLNWKPKISFKDGLTKTVRFYSENFDKLKKIFPY
jgi:dTDP-glucose 4,6-dehydratase